VEKRERGERAATVAGRQRAGDAASAGAERHYLLVSRFALLNLLGFALLAVAYALGWVDIVLAGDTSGISILIFAASRELDAARAVVPAPGTRIAHYLALTLGRDATSRALAAATLRLKLLSRIASVRFISQSLVTLGLIGTVIRFIQALSGVEADAAGTVETIRPMIATLIAGMGVALYTTLVGAVLSIWLLVNHSLLAGGTVRLITAIVERGEREAMNPSMPARTRAARSSATSSCWHWRASSSSCCCCCHT